MLGWPRPVWISRAIHLSVPVPVPGGIPTKLRTPQFRRWLRTGSRSAFVHRELVLLCKGGFGLSDMEVESRAFDSHVSFWLAMARYSWEK